MALPAFMANQFPPLDFFSIVGCPNHVPPYREWNIYLPKFNENSEKRPDQHLKDFHECMEERGILLEDVQMKVLKLSLEGDARVWFKTLPHGSISSFKCFHATFYQYYKRFYPQNASLEDCCTMCNDENSLEVDESVEDVGGAPLQESIYPHQVASPYELKREEQNTTELQINSQRAYSVESNVSPSYDKYDFDGESSEAELPYSQLWEVEQVKEAPAYDAYLSHEERDQGSPPIYDSYDSKEEEMVMEAQKELFTNKWGESSQQEVSQGEPKVERTHRVYCYLLQQDACQEFSSGPPIYDSYSSNSKESVTDFQDSCPIEKGAVNEQQPIFLGNTKAEEIKGVCSCPDQEDIGQQATG